VAESLKGYVQKLKKGGYDEPTIRAHLFSQGYSLQQINEAFAARNLVGKKTIFFIFGLAALLVALILAYFLLSSPSKSISFRMQPVAVEISQGQSVLFDDLITNTGKQSGFTVSLKHDVYNQNSILITSTQDTIIANGAQTKRQEVLLPADIVAGRYFVKATAAFNGKQESAAFSFKLITGRAVQPAIPSTPATPETSAAETCEANCNDNDLCTQDSCVGKSCVHEEITPCCGNLVCENIETTVSCPRDCKELPRGKTSSELADEAKSVAASNPDRASLLCSSIPQESIADACFSSVAEESSNSAFCARVKNSETKSNCYVSYALKTNDFSVCSSVEDVYLKRTCFNLKNLEAMRQSTA
jgi:hypothetical protein